jgi:predicted transglutaminase-like cysteine proteinase
VKKRSTTSGVIISVLIALLIVGAMVPAGLFSPVFSHQPLFTSQMQLLITPDDPLVVQTLRTILDEPLPEITEQNYFMNFDNSLHDFNRIKNWLGRFLVDVTDKTAHGVEDYWQLPAETLQLGTGDCEDYAILLCSLLRAYGVPAEDVYVAVGMGVTREDHAWVVEKYYKGGWRIISRYSGEPIVCNSLSDGLKAELFFNDTDGFRRSTILPSGVLEFELPESYYPLISVSGTLGKTYPKGYAAVTYLKKLKAGQKVKASVEWLPDSVYSPFNPLIIYPWSFYVYDRGGNVVFSWTGTDVNKDLEFTVSARGTYEIEVVKRDSAPRFGRITVDPAGWENQPSSNLFHTPNTDFVAVPIPVPAAPTHTILATDSVPSLSHEKLVQQVLDLINDDRTELGIPIVSLGSNPAAQNHAQDMLDNLFYSHWGSDGLNSSMRYTLAGGTGYTYEKIYVSSVSWTGGGEAAFEQTILSALDSVMEEYSSAGEPFRIKKVNIGISYNTESLFLVLQFETTEVDFSRSPVLRNGILDLSWQKQRITEPISIFYHPLPYQLSPTQLNNAPEESEGRLVARIYSTEPRFSGLQLYPYLLDQRSDPYSVPVDAPLDLNNSDGPELLYSIYLGLVATIWESDGETFSVTADLSQIISRFGPGVYTVAGDYYFFAGASTGTETVYGAGRFTLQPVFMYSIFVE